MNRNTANVWVSGFTAAGALSAFAKDMPAWVVAGLIVLSILNWKASTWRD